MDKRKLIYFLLQMVEYAPCVWMILAGTLKNVESTKRKNIWTIWTILMATLLAYNGLFSRISTGIVLFMPILIAIGVSIILKKHFLVTYLWNFFTIGILSFVKLFVLIIKGLYENKNIIEINHESVDGKICLIEFIIVMHIPQELRIRSRGTDAQFLRNMH